MLVVVLVPMPARVEVRVAEMVKNEEGSKKAAQLFGSTQIELYAVLNIAGDCATFHVFHSYPQCFLYSDDDEDDMMWCSAHCLAKPSGPSLFLRFHPPKPFPFLIFFRVRQHHHRISWRYKGASTAAER